MKKKIRIKDIQTSDLLYFDTKLDTEAQGRCLEFCNDRDIDCLPSLDDPGKVYVRDNSKSFFQLEEVTEDRKVDGRTNIFNPQLLQKFAAKPLLMVFSDNELTGVVHFSDYNKPVVSTFLYETFLAYERSPRIYLIKKGLKNSDMLAYFGMKKNRAEKEGDIQLYESKIQEFHRSIAKNAKLQHFESFYFRDLIALLNNRKITKLRDMINDLRNMVMHAHDFVNLENPDADNMIYNFETFKKFFEMVLILQEDYKRVSNHIAFMS